MGWEDNREHSWEQEESGAEKCSAPERKTLRSLLIDEVAAAILLPTSFVVFQAEGFLLAVADGFDAAGAHSRRYQSAFNRRSPLVAEGEIVFS
jgi:hypothetical protein